MYSTSSANTYLDTMDSAPIPAAEAPVPVQQMYSFALMESAEDVVKVVDEKGKSDLFQLNNRYEEEVIDITKSMEQGNEIDMELESYSLTTVTGSNEDHVSGSALEGTNSESAIHFTKKQKNNIVDFQQTMIDNDTPNDPMIDIDFILPKFFARKEISFSARLHMWNRLKSFLYRRYRIR